MTVFLRRAGLLTLAMLVMVLSVAGVATAQDDGPSCYPVPPGGCEPGEITCEDIIAAIAAEDPALDQNGDGVMDAADLPASCTCEELVQAVADGTLDESDLPEECVEDEVEVEDEDEVEVTEVEPTEVTCEDIIAAIGAGDVALDQNGDGVMDAADLPADCGCDALRDAVAAGTLDEADLPEECVEADVAVLATTGAPAAPMAALAAVGLLAGFGLVRVSRRV